MAPVYCRVAVEAAVSSETNGLLNTAKIAPPLPFAELPTKFFDLFRVNALYIVKIAPPCLYIAKLLVVGFIEGKHSMVI